MSIIAISIRYLRGQPLSCLGGYSSALLILGLDLCLGLILVLIIGLGLVGLVLSLISGLISVDSCCKYGFITVHRKDVVPLGSLTVYISPLTVSKLYGLSHCPA